MTHIAAFLIFTWMIVYVAVPNFREMVKDTPGRLLLALGLTVYLLGCLFIYINYTISLTYPL